MADKKNNDYEIKVEQLLALKEKLHQSYDYVSPNVTVGDYTYGRFDFKEFEDGTKLNIGKFCSIAEYVTFIMGGEHRADFATTYPFNVLVDSFKDIKGHPRTKGDIIVGNDVWIGFNSKILSGVTIGDGAIVGANSLVTRDVEPYSIVAGNPAKFIRYRFDEETIKKFQKLKWWDLDEKELVKIIPLLESDNYGELIKNIK